MRCLISAFLAGLFLTSCASHPPEVGILELTPYVGRLLTVDVGIDGEEMKALFDSGAGVTAVTPELAHVIGCIPFGRVVGQRMTGERVDFESCGERSLVMNDFEAKTEIFIFDLMALLPDDLPQLGGIISLASLRNTPFTLDLAGERIILETPQSLRHRTQMAQKATLWLKEGIGGARELTAFVKMDAEVGELWFLLDTANLDDVFVSEAALRQLAGEDFRKFAATEGEAIELDLTIAGLPAFSARTKVRDIIYDGVLNEAALRKFLITFDIANKSIWFAPAEFGKNSN